MGGCTRSAEGTAEEIVVDPGAGGVRVFVEESWKLDVMYRRPEELPKEGA